MGDECFRACAVLPAGGCGQRLGLPTPKQYVSILGRPLVSYTLEAFERVPWIEHIVLVVSSEWHGDAEQILSNYNHQKVSLAEGQVTRHRSIYSGIKALSRAGHHPDVVIIHDAVRPFVTESILQKITAAAMAHGAAGSIRPLVSTVIGTTPDSLLSHSLDRSQYRASEMPQAFQLDVITKAYSKCTEHDLDFGTECLHLAQKYGSATVKLIEGDANLWKVTYKRDIYAAEGMIKETHSSVMITSRFQDEETNAALENALTSVSLTVSYGSEAAKDPLDAAPCTYVACVHCLGPVGEQCEMTEVVLERLLRARHRTMSYGVIFVAFLSDGSAASHVDSLRRAVLSMAARFRPKDVCLNLVLVESETSECWNALRPFPEIVADLAFNRNPTLSGQTLYARGTQ